MLALALSVLALYYLYMGPTLVHPGYTPPACTIPLTTGWSDACGAALGHEAQNGAIHATTLQHGAQATPV